MSLMGIYSALAVPVLPWTQPVLLVYLAYTDGQGEIPLKLQLVDWAEAGPPLFVKEKPVHFPNPRFVVENVFYETNVVFPEEGEYRLQLFAAGQFLKERPLMVSFGRTNGRR